MTVAVVVLAALLATCVALLVLERRRRQHLARTAERQRLDLAERLAQVERDLDGATATATTERDARRAAQDDLAATAADLEAAQAGVAAASAEAEQLRQHLADAVDQRDCLHQQLASATPGGDAGALWALELARSERTWRHSVALAPGADSPFADAEDPLRLAVEVEAAALREEVGAPLEVRWQADVAHPGDALLVLRLAQELLAQAARQGMAARLAVEGPAGSGEIVLSLDKVDDDDPEPQVVLPSLPDHVVSVGDGAVRVRTTPGRSSPLSSP